MLPNNGILKCNSCGYSDESSDNSEYTVSGKRETKETVTNLGEDVDVGPVTTETCPKCGNERATYKLLQTRSADEAPTRIFTCTKCKHTWRAYDWGFYMKDSKEKEHRISDLRDMIDTIKEDPNSPSYADIEEDSELIDYLNEDKVNFNEMEINDEFIYNPNDDEKRSPVNLDDTNINEKYIIKTPKEEDAENRSKNEEPEDIIGDVSENFDSILNAKIGRTPILAILSTILGLLLVLISAFIFQSRSDRVIDNVVSGETNFISVIVLAIGVLLLIYGFYKIFGIKNPIGGITDSINSIDRSNEKKNVKDMKDDATEMVIPKSNIPLDKDSYKIGEFNLKELKNKLKKQPDSKKPTPITEDIDKIPPAKEKEESKKGLTPEEIEDIEYEQTKLDSETIDEIFAEVEDIDEMPIISIDSEDKKE